MDEQVRPRADLHSADPVEHARGLAAHAATLIAAARLTAPPDTARLWRAAAVALHDARRVLPAGDPVRAEVTWQLGNLLALRFVLQTRDPADRRAAVALLHETGPTRPEPTRAWLGLLWVLGMFPAAVWQPLLVRRPARPAFEPDGTAPGHVLRTLVLAELGLGVETAGRTYGQVLRQAAAALVERAAQAPTKEAVDRAVTLAQRIVRRPRQALTSDANDRFLLGIALTVRSAGSGRLADLTAAVDQLYHTAEILTVGDELAPVVHGILATVLLERYKRHSNPTDLDTAIGYLRISELPSVLGRAMAIRAVRRDDVQELRRAVSLLRDVLLQPASAVNQARSRSALGLALYALGTRHDRGCLAEGTALLCEAAADLPTGDAERPSLMARGALAVIEQAVLTADVQLLDRGIDRLRRAMEFEGYASWETGLLRAGLGRAHQVRAQLTASPGDLDEAAAHYGAAYHLAGQERGYNPTPATLRGIAETLWARAGGRGADRRDAVRVGLDELRAAGDEVRLSPDPQWALAAARRVEERAQELAVRCLTPDRADTRSLAPSEAGADVLSEGGSAAPSEPGAGVLSEQRAGDLSEYSSGGLLEHGPGVPVEQRAGVLSEHGAGVPVEQRAGDLSGPGAGDLSEQWAGVLSEHGAGAPVEHDVDGWGGRRTDRLAQALDALEFGRGLVLHTCTAVVGVAEALRSRGLRGLAEEWGPGRAAPPADPVLHWAAPDGLRLRVLAALHDAEADGPPALAGTGADALVYLLPGHALVLDRSGGLTDLELPGLHAPGSLLDACRRAAGSGARSLEAKLRELCDWAWRAAMRPLLAHLRPVEGGPLPRLVLVPCGALGAVPWHAAGEGSRVVCREAIVTYAATGRQFVEASRRRRLPLHASPVLVGNPDGTLVQTTRCVDGLRDSFYAGAPAYGMLLGPTSGRGTPEEVLAWLPGSATPASVLHLGCHAAAGESAAGSHLSLAGGRLQLARMLRQTQTRPAGGTGGLVVLSACGAGPDGETTELAELADETSGLAASFLAAGATGVVDARWPVPDVRVAVFMTVFHERLQALADDPPAALRATQLWMLDPARRLPASMPKALRDAAVSHDVDLTAYESWAAFTCHGA